MGSKFIVYKAQGNSLKGLQFQALHIVLSNGTKAIVVFLRLKWTLSFLLLYSILLVHFLGDKNDSRRNVN